MNIKKFKPGDIITRIEPSKLGDHSHLCEKLELIEIKSRTFYCKLYSDSFPYKMWELGLSEYGTGWEYYIESDKNKMLKDQYDRKKQIALQINKLSNERENIGTVFVVNEQNQNDKKLRARMNKCDKLWLKIHELERAGKTCCGISFN